MKAEEKSALTPLRGGRGGRQSFFATDRHRLTLPMLGLRPSAKGILDTSICDTLSPCPRRPWAFIIKPSKDTDLTEVGRKWVPANDMRGSSLLRRCSGQVRYERAGKRVNHG
jgi:hypothetical protein